MVNHQQIMSEGITKSVDAPLLGYGSTRKSTIHGYKILTVGNCSKIPQENSHSVLQQTAEPSKNP